MSETNNSKKEPRIDNTAAGFMVIVMAFFDLISTVPGLNYISFIFGNGVIIVWLWFKRVSFFGTKKSVQKIITMGTQWLIEVIPLLSIAPGLTVSVIIMLAIIRTEDATGINPMHIKKLKSARIGDSDDDEEEDGDDKEDDKEEKPKNDTKPKKSRISSLKKAA